MPNTRGRGLISSLSLSVLVYVRTGNDCGNENYIIVPSLNSTLEAGGPLVGWTGQDCSGPFSPRISALNVTLRFMESWCAFGPEKIDNFIHK